MYLPRSLCNVSHVSVQLSQREMLEMKVRQLRQELLWQTQRRQLEEDKLGALKAATMDRGGWNIMITEKNPSFKKSFS